MRYACYENDNPCILPDSKVWNRYIYPTFKEAKEYMVDWLGQNFSGYPGILGEKWYYYDTDYVVIREIRENT